MKMIIPCMECNKEGLYNLDFIDVEINNSGIYEATCNKGHKIATVSQEFLFEVLFDMGGLALIDGYNREAVTNFAASLERFYEFCIEVISYSFSIEQKDFEETWKLVNRSERQIGAFYFLYLNKFNEKPLSIEKEKVNQSNIIKFRNDIVHNGYIPSKKDALEYGEKVFDYINAVLNKLKEPCADEILQVIINKQRKYREQKNIEENATFSTMASPTMIGLSNNLSGKNERNFNDALSALENSISFRFRR